MNCPGDITISDFDKVYEVYEIADIWYARWVQHVDKPWPNNFIDSIIGEFSNCKDAKKFCEVDSLGQLFLF